MIRIRFYGLAIASQPEGAPRDCRKAINRSGELQVQAVWRRRAAGWLADPACKQGKARAVWDGPFWGGRKRYPQEGADDGDLGHEVPGWRRVQGKPCLAPDIKATSQMPMRQRLAAPLPFLHVDDIVRSCRKRRRAGAGSGSRWPTVRHAAASSSALRRRYDSLPVGCGEALPLRHQGSIRRLSSSISAGSSSA